MFNRKVWMVIGVLAIPLLLFGAYLYGLTQPYHPFPEYGTAMVVDPAKDLPVTVCVGKENVDITTWINRTVSLKSRENESLFVQFDGSGSYFWVSSEDGQEFPLTVFKVMAEPTSYQIWGLTPEKNPVYFDQGDHACYRLYK
ncbi:MAG TPA: hypothetical protein VF837_04555 [Patescibacteria group bacterium]